jgi:PAS domain S-box-containing protein
MSIEQQSGAGRRLRLESIGPAMLLLAWTLVAVIFGVNLYSSYQGFLLEKRVAVHDQTLAAVSTTAAVIDGHFGNLHIMLNAVAEFYAKLDGPITPFDPRMEDYIRSLTEHTPFYSDVRIFDAVGEMVHGIGDPSPFTQKDFFADLVARQFEEERLAIAPPFAQQGSPGISVTVALRRISEQGEFLGAVTANVQFDLMQRQLRDLLKGWQGRIFLYRGGGRFLVELPLREGRKSGFPAVESLRSLEGVWGWLEGDYSLYREFPASSGGPQRYRLIYRNGINAPLVYLGEHPRQEAMGLWLRDNWPALIIYIGMLLLGALISLFLIRLLERLRRTNQELVRVVEAEKLSRQSKEEALTTRDTLLNNSLVMITLVVGGRFAWINHRTEQMFGYGEDELIGQEVRLLYADPESYQNLERTASATLTSGGSYVSEVLLKHRDGREIWCIASGKAMDPEKPAEGVIWIVLDISERKHYEQELAKAKRVAESANQAKTLFLTNMSHELRTPLNAILGYARVLKRQPDKLMESAHAIENAGGHLLDLLNDLLDVARIEAGRLVLDVDEFSLGRFLDDLSEMVRVRAQERDLSFKAEIREGVRVGIEADQKRLRQILLNLLTNAIKFTEKGQVSLKVDRVDAEEADQATVSFVVEDTGMGVSRDQRERIFRFFEQGDASRQQPDPGSGLGLAISRRLVRLMGGEIELESTPGEGSRFSFQLRFPLRDHVADEGGEASRPVAYLGPRKRLLVVDDVTDNRRILRLFLEQVGFLVDEAESAQAAVIQAGATPPDAILMDLRMPRVDGIEAAAMIRALPRLSQVPIIAISASLSELGRAARAHAFAAGLHKPVDELRLFEELGNILGLEWESNEDGAVMEEGASAPCVPPEQQLNELYGLVSMGRTSRVRAWIDELEGKEERYGPFLKSIRERLQQFDLDGLERMIEEHLNRARQQSGGD